MLTRRRAALVTIAIGIPVVLLACVDPPPKIASIPASGLALRVHVFGADAQEAKGYFTAARQNNRGFTVVQEGGDGDVVVGLENDSPKCVAPTALCSYKVSFRVRDRNGETLQTTTTNVAASSDKCAELCSKALVQVATKVIDVAAGLLVAAGSVPREEAGAEPEPSAAAVAAGDASSSVAAAEADAPPGSKAAGKKKPPAKVEVARPEPVMCAVGHGPRLQTDDAERRAAQVEALKRLEVLDQAEYDCLRKAYLDRL